MRKQFLRLGALAAVSAAVVMAACSDNGALAPEIERSDAITQIEYEAVKRGKHTMGFTCNFRSDSEGGEAKCGPHTLFVPANAFSAEVVDFTIMVKKGDEVRVQLHATSVGSSVANDVGAAGFDAPLNLTLTFAGSTNVAGKKKGGKQGLSEDDMVIAWVRPDGSYEELPTVINKETHSASADLHHFSEYALLVP